MEACSSSAVTRELISDAAEALARQLGAPEAVAVAKPELPAKPIRWRLWGPVIGGHAAADWSVSSQELTLGDSTHRDSFRRQWCLGE